MSIFLKPVQRRNPLKPDEVMKWYPVQNTVKMVDESEVAELIADETTLNPMEAQMAIRQLRKIVQRLLLDGKRREAGQLGLVQRQPEHRRRSHERRTDRPQREVGKHQLPARRRTESRHAESRFRVAEQDDGRQTVVRFRFAR